MQKWSKGKVREKLQNLVLFDQKTYDRMLVEVPKVRAAVVAVARRGRWAFVALRLARWDPRDIGATLGLGGPSPPRVFCLRVAHAVRACPFTLSRR